MDLLLRRIITTALAPPLSTVNSPYRAMPFNWFACASPTPNAGRYDAPSAFAVRSSGCGWMSGSRRRKNVGSAAHAATAAASATAISLMSPQTQSADTEPRPKGADAGTDTPGRPQQCAVSSQPLFVRHAVAPFAGFVEMRPRSAEAESRYHRIVEHRRRLEVPGRRRCSFTTASFNSSPKPGFSGTAT